MIYVLAALLPPLGLLLNGQPFSALFNLVLIVVCVLFGLLFPVLFFVPSAHAIIAVAMKREDRRRPWLWPMEKGASGAGQQRQSRFQEPEHLPGRDRQFPQRNSLEKISARLPT